MYYWYILVIIITNRYYYYFIQLAAGKKAEAIAMCNGVEQWLLFVCVAWIYCMLLLLELHRQFHCVISSEDVNMIVVLISHNIVIACATQWYVQNNHNKPILLLLINLFSLVSGSSRQEQKQKIVCDCVKQWLSFMYVFCLNLSHVIIALNYCLNYLHVLLCNIERRYNYDCRIDIT